MSNSVDDKKSIKNIMANFSEKNSKKPFKERLMLAHRIRATFLNLEDKNADKDQDDEES
jgi:hypothetical protein